MNTNENYWIVSLASPDLAEPVDWGQPRKMLAASDRGLVFSSKDEAVQLARHMLSCVHSFEQTKAGTANYEDQDLKGLLDEAVDLLNQATLDRWTAPFCRFEYQSDDPFENYLRDKVLDLLKRADLGSGRYDKLISDINGCQ